MDQFMIALKKEKAPRGHFVNMTHVTDLQFKDILKGETIIEYPIFYVWLKTDETPKDILVMEDKKQLIAVLSETCADKSDNEMDIKPEIDTESIKVEETATENIKVEESPLKADDEKSIS